MKKVFVSGCYDLLHSGHIQFFKKAAEYGKLYVSIGSDKTVQELKGKASIYSEKERLFMVAAIKYVHRAFVARGSGQLDFKKEIEKIKPDIFVVNKDGDREEKRKYIKSLGIKYIVLKRTSYKKLPTRSTTGIFKKLCLILKKTE